VIGYDSPILIARCFTTERAKQTTLRPALAGATLDVAAFLRVPLTRSFASVRRFKRKAYRTRLTDTAATALREEQWTSFVYGQKAASVGRADQDAQPAKFWAERLC
jgi:hypothetical protein